MGEVKTGSRRIEAVTFDAYGTLLYAERPIERLRDELRNIGLIAPLETVQEAFLEEVHYYKTHHLEAKDPEPLLALRHRCADVLFGKLAQKGYTVEVSAEQKLAVLLKIIRFKVYDDALPVLAWCASKGLMTGVISNWDCSLPEILGERLDGHRFDCILVSAVEGMNKSDPAMYHRAAKRLGLFPSRILHIGDEMENDLHAPLRAGWNAILLDRRSHQRGTKGPFIKALTDLPTTIKNKAYHRP